MFKNDQSDSDDEGLIVDAYESKTMPKSMQRCKETKKTADKTDKTVKSTKPCKGVPLSHAERRAACQRLIDERKKKEEQDAKDAMAALEEEEEEEEDKEDTEDEDKEDRTDDEENEEEEVEEEVEEEEEEEEEEDEEVEEEDEDVEEEVEDTEDPEEKKELTTNHQKIEIVNALAAIARPTTVKPIVVPVTTPFIPQRMVLNNGIDHNNVRIVITIQNGQTEVSFR